MMHTKIIAHRGASADAPENTMPAFKLALQQGAQMLEFDVRPTADGAVVVFHDHTTERWNGQPQPVHALTLAQMQELDIAGAPVPTLDELLQWAATTDLALNIEIKAPGIEASVARLVHEYALRERVIISSFDQQILHVMREVAPEVDRGVLVDIASWTSTVGIGEESPVPNLRQHTARAWHPSWKLPLLDQLIPAVRQAGFAVHVWTVDDPGMMRQLLALEVEGIITNRPALLRDVRAAWQAERASQA